jgi:L-threonylcarbamoyladenylate synthase
MMTTTPPQDPSAAAIRALRDRITAEFPDLADRVATDPRDAGAIGRAVDVLHAGGLVVFYSAMTYGIAVSAESAAAVERLYELKGRPAQKALPILSSRRKYHSTVLANEHNRAPLERAINSLWPGPVTFIVEKLVGDGGYVVPDYVTAGQTSVALMCMDVVAESLADRAEFVVAATSANLSGHGSLVCAEDCLRTFKDQVDFYLVGPASEVGVNTTIVNVSVTPPAILRAGPCPAARLREYFPDLKG